MELSFQLHSHRSRFGIEVKCDEFDGRPGLEQIWFDGVNEPVSADVAALAAWLLLAPFVSQRFRFPEKVSRPLLNKIMATWGAPIEMGPAEDEPARFPPRTGTLFIECDDREVHRQEQPVYRLRRLPLNASGTTYAGPEIAIRTNVDLLGQGLVPLNFAHLIAPAIIYADFIGISDLVVSRAAIDLPPPMKRTADVDPVSAWRELLKAAGFNLRVEG